MRGKKDVSTHQVTIFFCEGNLVFEARDRRHSLLFIWCFDSVDVWFFLSPAVIGTQRGWCSGYWDIRKKEGGNRCYRLLPLPFAYKGG